MTYAFISFVIATFLFAIAALLVLLNEPDLGGLNPLEWAIVGLPFFGLGHWIPGGTR